MILSLYSNRVIPLIIQIFTEHLLAKCYTWHFVRLNNKKSYYMIDSAFLYLHSILEVFQSTVNTNF